MSGTFEKHLAAIRAGQVTKTNVIGIRKALNAAERRYRGYSTSSTAPKVAPWQAAELQDELAQHKPKVAGELHESGLKVLRNPRYAKRLAHYAAAIAAIDHFRLVGFDDVHNGDFVPVYAVWSKVPPVAGHDPFPEGATYEAFRFRNIPWQTASAYGLDDGPRLVGE